MAWFEEKHLPLIKKIMFVDEVSLFQDTLFRVQSKLWIQKKRVYNVS